MDLANAIVIATGAAMAFLWGAVVCAALRAAIYQAIRNPKEPTS